MCDNCLILKYRPLNSEVTTGQVSVRRKGFCAEQKFFHIISSYGTEKEYKEYETTD
jgi:hypothetical protein